MSGIVTTQMDVNMKARFLDRELAKTLGPVMRKYFTRAGAVIRSEARQSLVNAAQKKLSDLTEKELKTYRKWQAKFKAGNTPIKPRKPDKSAKRGQPPLLHPKRGAKSLLKSRLFFALSEDRTYVVIGPELIGANKRIKREGRGLSSVEELEQGFPFMEPAFQAILPQLPKYLEMAKG